MNQSVTSKNRKAAGEWGNSTTGYEQYTFIDYNDGRCSKRRLWQSVSTQCLRRQLGIDSTIIRSELPHMPETVYAGQFDDALTILAIELEQPITYPGQSKTFDVFFGCNAKAFQETFNATPTLKLSVRKITLSPEILKIEERKVEVKDVKSDGGNSVVEMAQEVFGITRKIR